MTPGKAMNVKVFPNPSVNNFNLQVNTTSGEDIEVRVLDMQGFPGAEISGVRIHNSAFKGITKEDMVIEADVKLVDSTVERKK